MKTLEQLYEEHCGKVSDKWSLYLAEYDRLLSPYRTQPIDFLEIGVQNGGSLDIWSQFFPHAGNLIGCDINPACATLRYDDPRISIVIGDANLDETERVVATHAERFDVVIDDGSHTSKDIVRAFFRYFPRVKDGGVFIAEDLHCSYWAGYGGGIYHPYSSITFFKQLADVINREHWGVDKRVEDLLGGFRDEYGCEISEDVLAMVHSVEFVNSICVVRKAAAGKNVLGRRVVVGERAAVENAVLKLRSSQVSEITNSQAENEWSTPERSPADLRQRVDAQSLQIASLQREKTSYEEQIGAVLRDVSYRQGQLDELRMVLDRHEQRALGLSGELKTLREKLTALNGEKQDLEGCITELRGRLEGQITHLQHEVASRDQQIDKLRHDVHALVHSTSWRLTRPLRWPKLAVLKAHSVLDRATAGGGVRVAVAKAYGVYRREGLAGVWNKLKWVQSGAPGVVPRKDYEAWVQQYDQIDDATRDAILKRIKRMEKSPTISIVMPVYNPKPEWLAEAIESVRGQLYPHWELCIADDVSPNPEVRKLLERYVRKDKRIKVVFREKNGHISAASNSALELATGEWVALLDHDDLLPEHALYCVAMAIDENPSAKLIYSDEDKINESGRRCDPYFKCDWNPDLFYSHNMFSHLGVYQKALLDEVGGFRLGYEGSQDYDLALRCLELAGQSAIHHIPRVLYHWRVHAESTASGADAKPYAAVAGEHAINEHFSRRNVDCTVEYIGYGYRARYALPAKPPLVSLIIPTRNAEQLTRQCIDSVLDKTTYANFEIIIVDNGSDDPDALRYFESAAGDSRIRVLRDDRPFNYSALNNAAVKEARGELVCLMNNDIEVISPDWLSEMVGLALQPDIGAVGARLLYPNDTIQHAGLVLGILGVAGNAHKHCPRSTHGYFGRASLINAFSAVTAACLVIRKSVYEEVGGLNEVDLTVAYNDVDFCLRVREAGYRNVWTPYAELYHHESATRGQEDDPVKHARFMREFEYMKQRWAGILRTDPCYSPNLTLDHDNFSLAWPPRVKALV